MLCTFLFSLVILCQKTLITVDWSKLDFFFIESCIFFLRSSSLHNFLILEIVEKKLNRESEISLNSVNFG